MEVLQFEQVLLVRAVLAEPIDHYITAVTQCRRVCCVPLPLVETPRSFSDSAPCRQLRLVQSRQSRLLFAGKQAQ